MEEDLRSYVILFIVCIVSTILLRALFIRTHTRNSKLRLPPRPLALPVTGHLHLLGSLPHQALHKLSKRYGPLFHLSLGSVPCVVASSPEIAKQFLKTQEVTFSNRPQRISVDYLTSGSTDFTFGPCGTYWKFMKKVCMSELLGGRTLNQFIPVRREEIERFVQLMMKKADEGAFVDVSGEVMRLTNNIVSRMIMSRRCSGNENEADEVRKVVKETAELNGKFNVSDYIGLLRSVDLQRFGARLKEVHEKFQTMMDRIIKEHEEARKDKRRGGGDNEMKDLLDILLDISEDESSDIRLTRQDIKAFILDMFVAGTDTSAVTTEWAVAELINNPIILNKAREEIDYVVGKNRLVEESDIANLPYLQAIVKETLRLHPAGPLLVRESSESCTINGFDIPRKTQLLVNVRAIGRDPKYWENPLEFKPERFLEKQLDLRGQHFEFLPFGSGRRGCPGISLGLQIVHASLASMIQCFDWKLKEGCGAVDMEEGPGLTLPRAHPILCVPVARLRPITSQ